MKRRSDIVYIPTNNISTDINFSSKPSFDFDIHCLPKLVDYSYHEDSEDEEPRLHLHVCSDTVGEFNESGDKTEKVEMLPTGFIGRGSKRFSVLVREDISSKLKAEEDEERRRNERHMTHLNQTLRASKRLCDSERPGKKRKLDVSSVFDRLLSKKSCRLLRGKKQGSKKRELVTSELDESLTVTPRCFMGFLKHRK